MNTSTATRPLSQTEEKAFYGAELSQSAIEYGQNEVLRNMDLVGEFFSESPDVRTPSAYFGPISTPDLLGLVLLNKDATDGQLAAAARELRIRVLAHYSERALAAAQEAEAA